MNGQGGGSFISYHALFIIGIELDLFSIGAHYQTIISFYYLSIVELCCRFFTNRICFNEIYTKLSNAYHGKKTALLENLILFKEMKVYLLRIFSPTFLNIFLCFITMWSAVHSGQRQHFLFVEECCSSKKGSTWGEPREIFCDVIAFQIDEGPLTTAGNRCCTMGGF